MDIWLKIDRPIDIDADIPLKDEASIEIKNRYKNDWGNFILWANSETETIGLIRYNRSISMPLRNVKLVELQEMKPAKGQGYINLAFVSKSGINLGSIGSKNSRKSFDWLTKIQPIIANTLELEHKYTDNGYDA